jgi:hypothetical protein
MHFNIRSISLAESIASDAQVVIGDLLGTKIEFRSGISIEVTLPHTLTEFDAIPQRERLLAALKTWSRVYRFPSGKTELIHIIAVAEDANDQILFYRIDLVQPPPTSRRAPRSPVQLVGGEIMDYDRCVEWLVDTSYDLSTDPDKQRRALILPRQPQVKFKPITTAWVGPELIDGLAMPLRLAAIGKVYGADIVHVAPRNFHAVKARLAGVLPLDAVIICRHFGPYITEDAVPDGVRRDLIHNCDSSSRTELEKQIHAWLQIVTVEVEKEDSNLSSDQDQRLLQIMLRGMLSHSKIGQFSHCQKETVLKGVRARHLHVPTAERILDENSDLFQETKASNALFLYKDHNDGRQYFLNPQRVDEVKAIAAASLQ